MSRRLFIGFLLTLAPIVAFLFLYLAQDPILGTERDFGVFWTASALLLQGKAAIIYDSAGFRAEMLDLMGADFPDLPFLYPPHALLFLAPLAILPPLPAMIAWLAATFLALGAALRRTLVPGFLLLGALLISPASIVNIACGQNGYLTAALFAGGLLMLRKQPVLAGICIGCLSFKPQLGLILPFVLIAGQHGRAFIAACVTTLALLALSWLVLGSAAWSLYLGQTAPAQADLIRNFDFTSFAVYMAARAAAWPAWLAVLLQAGAVLLALIGSIWVIRQPIAAPLQAAVIMTGSFFAAPYVLPYDMIVVAAATLLAFSATRLRPAEMVVLALAWLLPAFTFPRALPIAPLIMLLLFLTLLQVAAGSRGKREA